MLPWIRQQAFKRQADGKTLFDFPATAIMCYQNGTSPYPHHITIRKCIVHDCGGGGISTQTTDYITIEETPCTTRLVFPVRLRGSRWLEFQITITTTTNYRVFVRRNQLLFKQELHPPFKGRQPFPTRRGEGIIIDHSGRHGRQLSWPIRGGCCSKTTWCSTTAETA